MLGNPIGGTGVGMIPLKVIQAGKSKERETAWKILPSQPTREKNREMRNGIQEIKKVLEMPRQYWI